MRVFVLFARVKSFRQKNKIPWCPHLYYYLYDKVFNESFHAKLASLQYNATLAITGAISGSSTKKSYEKIGLESLKSRRWYRKMSFLYKVLKSKSLSCHFNTIPNNNT